MDVDYTNAFIFVLHKGSNADLARLHHCLPNKINKLSREDLNLLDTEYQNHLSLLRETSRDGVYPFNFESDNPNSIMSTSLALSRLIEFDLLEDPLSISIIEQLINLQNDTGWWKDSDTILEIEDLPYYQNPSNASVRIFNTTFVSSVLADVPQQEIENSLIKADQALHNITSSNGVISGFPQSNWFATKMIARVHGLDSSRFLLHWSLLSDLADELNDPGSLAAIAENLLEAGVPAYDPLINKCKRKIKSVYAHELIDRKKYMGWCDSNNKLDPTITLQCLIILGE